MRVHPAWVAAAVFGFLWRDAERRVDEEFEFGRQTTKAANDRADKQRQKRARSVSRRRNKKGQFK